MTDPLGRFHHVTNAYCCDQAIFPIVGSVNLVLTGLTLAHRLAQHAAPLEDLPKAARAATRVRLFVPLVEVASEAIP